MVFLWYIIRKCNTFENALEKNEFLKKKLMEIELLKIAITHYKSNEFD